MKINSIHMKNFRNYDDMDINFRNYNIIIGKNAQGKSNLIEAIYYLGNGYSFRTMQNKELIHWGNDWLRVEGQCENREGTFHIKSFISEKERAFLIDDVKLKRLAELYRQICVCVFEPDDLLLIKGNPGKRRNFLDKEIVSIYPSYYDVIKKYNTVNYQRNILLKECRKDRKKRIQLEDWTELYIKLAYKIVLKRKEFIELNKPFLKDYVRKISKEKEEVGFRYQVREIDDERILTLKDYTREFEKTREEEIGRGNSLFGPHRDDFIVEINGFDAKKYGSQGQQRTIALSLKLSYLDVVKKMLGEYPIFLLDDVMSELDEDRRNILSEVIQQKIQTFITTTDINFHKKYVGQALVLQVENGKTKIIQG